ncbi:MAG: hypothetical protein RL226_513 [Bacteroidota bacterium]
MRIVIPLFVILLNACMSASNGHSKEVKTIDSLLTEIETAAPAFLAINADSVEFVLSTMKDDMRRMELLTKEQMDVESATIFSEYNSAKRLIKDFNGRNKRLNKELERTRIQLNGLKESLASGATEDAQGNIIDANYVSKQMSIETRIAAELIDEMKNTVLYADEALREYNRLKPTIEDYLTTWQAQQEK